MSLSPSILPISFLILVELLLYCLSWWFFWSSSGLIASYCLFCCSLWLRTCSACSNLVPKSYLHSLPRTSKRVIKAAFTLISKIWFFSIREILLGFSSMNWTDWGGEEKSNSKTLSFSSSESSLSLSSDSSNTFPSPIPMLREDFGVFGFGPFSGFWKFCLRIVISWFLSVKVR